MPTTKNENKELTKLTLKNVKVIFFNKGDDGFKPSIIIDVTHPELQKKITEWVKENNIGKDNPGVANFKTYQPEESDSVIQYTFKITEYTKFVSDPNHDYTKEDLGYGAIINLTVNPFCFDNKFGKGISSAIGTVLIKQKANSATDDDLIELLEDDEDCPWA